MVPFAIRPWALVGLVLAGTSSAAWAATVNVGPADPGQLDRLEGVRVEMSRVYRDVESGKRDSQEGARLVYMLTQSAKVLELTEIERRLDLEERSHAKLLAKG